MSKFAQVKYLHAPDKIGKMMKNWSIWIDNIFFILSLGIITFLDDVHRITGIPVRILLFITGVMIVLSAIKSFSKLVALIKKLMK